MIELAWKIKTLTMKVTNVVQVQRLDSKDPWAWQTQPGIGTQGPIRKVNSEHDLIRKWS